jgi:hypothetical protein
LALHDLGATQPVFHNTSNGQLQGTKSTIITKKDMLRERSLNNAAGKKTTVGVKAGLNPY